MIYVSLILLIRFFLLSYEKPFVLVSTKSNVSTPVAFFKSNFSKKDIYLA